MTDALALRDNAKQQLMRIKDVEAGVDYLRKIAAIETWVKAEKKDAELQNIVAEQKLRTQRILGRLIQEGQARGEIAKKGDFGVIVDGDNDKKKLSDIGLTADQSSAFQKIYSIPEETFEEAIIKNKQAVDDAVSELTTAGMLRLAESLNPTDRKEREREPSFDFKKLIKIRNDFQISQYQLALECNIEASCVSRLETGELEWPYFDTIARIAEYFEVPMEYFKYKNLL